MSSKGDDSPGNAPVLRVYTIFCNPRDAPGKFVVRGFGIVRGREPVPDEKGYAVNTLEAARALLPDGLFRPRAEAGDHPTVVESWV
jgi:hypothetical protein